MIGIVFSMLRARRAQAVTLFLLAAIAVAAAVAGPVAMRATDAAVVRLAVEHAAERERAISVLTFGDPADAAAAADLDELAKSVVLPGFVPIRAGELRAFGPVTPAAAADLPATEILRVVFRERICEHLTVVSGRCLVGAGEVMLGEHTADQAGLAPGDVAILQASRIDNEGANIPDGPPVELTVVGVYRPTDLTDHYWAGQRYFPVLPDGRRGEVVFTTPATMQVIPHTVGLSTLDALAPAQVLTAQRLESLPDEVAAAVERADGGDILIGTGLPDLAERVATSRDLAGQLGPVAFIPLAAISLFVIYLAVGHGVSGRRAELGLVALRGVSTRRRWALATGESVAAILAGAPVGYVLGHVGVGAVASVAFGSSEGSELSTQSLPYALAALVVALGVAFLGQRTALRASVVELLRGVPRARSAWQTFAVEALVGALALVATLQLRLATNDGITGLGLLVPGLLVVAVALIAARALVPVAGLLGRFALRRGRLGTGLAAVELARRPGSQRLFVLLTVGAAMLSFVAAGTDVATRARDDRATVVTGATRVLTVEGADARRLLAATHQLDPEGAWAMAAVSVPPELPGAPPVLALDVSRLSTVVSWRPEYGADAAAVAAAIGAPPADPFVFRGTRLELDLEAVASVAVGFTPPPLQPLVLTLEFSTLSTGRPVLATVGALAFARQTLTPTVRGCEEGCRLVGLSVANPQFTVRLMVHAVRQLDPPADVIPPASLIDHSRWRASENGLASPSAGALVIGTQPQAFGAESVRVAVVDADLPVPLAAAGRDAVARINSLDRIAVRSNLDLALSLLPRLGTYGALVDLNYLERTVLQRPVAEAGEIWLGPAAPADAAELFRKAGLAVTGETGLEETRAALARQGPALALHFHVAAAVFGVLLALGGLFLVAAVDRRQRAADLRALRAQGLPRRIMRRVALWGYLCIVVSAALTGLAGAAVGWAAAGDKLPIFTDAGSVLSPPRWPDPQAVAQPWAIAGVTMGAAAIVAAWALRRASTRNGRGG